MTESRAHNIELMGRSFRIRSEDSAAHVAHVASFVDERLRSVGGASTVPTQENLLMTALTLADELLKLRAERDAYLARVRQTSESLLSRMAC